MKCILKNTPEFKKLSNIYGDTLAEKFIRDYSVNVKKISPDQEYYYPTNQEIKDWVSADKSQINDIVSKAIRSNPLITEYALNSLLNGVIHKLKGKTYVTRGFTKYGSILEQKAAEELVFKPNLNIVDSLAQNFPKIIKVKKSATNAFTVEVQITPVTERGKTEIAEKYKENLVDISKLSAFDINYQKQQRAKEIARKLGDKLSAAFNIPYSIITTAEASEILANSSTPYKGESAFFYNSNVYFVDEALSPEMVLHEFAHPLIKGIAKQNPVLFDKLYNQLRTSSAGVAIIENVVLNYPDIPFESDRFKEETIVNALEKAAMNKINKIVETEQGFKAFINNLIFAIKQVIKKLVGKVDLRKLDVDTTLDQLADMMISEDFVIENLIIDESDVAEFKKDLAAIVKQFEKIESGALQQMVNDVYAENRYEIDVIRKAPTRLKNLLESQEGVRFLAYIAEALQKYQTVTTDPKMIDPELALKAMEDQQEEFRLRSLALVNAIEYTEVFVENAEKAIEKIDGSRKKITSDQIGKVMYFKNFLLRQEDLMENIRMASGLSKETDFVKKINSVLTSIRDAKSKIDSIQLKFAGDFFEVNSELMAEDIDGKFKEDIKRAFKADNISEDDTNNFISSIVNNPLIKEFDIRQYNLKLNPKRTPYIVKIVQQYNDKRLTREQFDKFLKGERGDLGYIASTIIPLMNVDDPVVGTFVRFVTTELSTMFSKSLRQRDEIAKKLDPKLLAAGYNRNNVGTLGKQLLVLDKDGYRDSKTGDWVEYERFAFHDKFVNWRYEKGKLENDLEKAKELKDKDGMKNAYQALKEFEENYMYREKVPEYYEKQKMWTRENKLVNPFTKEEVIVDAQTSYESYLEREAARERINTLDNLAEQERDDLLEVSAADEARVEYEQLYNVFYPDGSKKSGKELEKVLVRKAYRSESRKFFENAVDEDGLQRDLNNFVNKLAAKGVTMDENPDVFNEELEKFFKKKMRIAYTNTYTESRADLIKQLRELTDKPGVKSEIAKKRADLVEERYEIISKSVDKNRQVNGMQLTEQQRARIKEIEVELVKLEDEFDKKTGLSKQEVARLKSYQDRINAGEKLSDDEMKDYQDIINIKNDMGMGPLELEKMRNIFRDLSAISYKEPTDYYIAAINYAIRGLDLEEVNLENADEWINSPKVIDARSRSEVFDDWFKQNHYLKEVWDPAVKQKVMKVFRTAAWNVAKPVDESNYKRTTLIHPITKEEIKRIGVPGGKYNRPVVKSEYLTPREIGKTIDNRGNWLPREYSISNPNSAKDDRFMNKEFSALKKNNSAIYQLLETLKEEYLKMQDGKSVGSRLYLDYPNFFHRSNLELIQSGKARETISEKAGVVKYYWNQVFGEKTPDAAEWGFNYNAEAVGVGTDVMGNPISRIPIKGMYRLKHTDVSMDFLRSVMEYMLSLNTQNTLRDIESTALAIKDVLNNPDNAIKNMEAYSKQQKKSKGVLAFLKQDTNRRAKTMDFVVDKLFYGKVNAEFNEANPTITRLANFLMGATSKSYIAMDLVSAAKNRYGMLFQAMIETAGGKYMTAKSYALGKYRAFTATIQLMTKDIYTLGPKSLDMQMMEHFDPITGKTRKDFSKSASRSFVKDMLDGSWMFDARKLAEVEAGLEVYWGMMYNKYIDQVDESGKVNKIRYADAFELDAEGMLKLKSGIDLEWGVDAIKHKIEQGDTIESIAKKYNITEEALLKSNGMEASDELEEGSELTISSNKLFNDFKLKIQGVGKKLNGLMDEYESPEANKYLAWRLFSFYRSFALPLFLNRFQMDTSKENFGGDVYDFNLGTLTKGYYISAWQAMARTIKTGGAYAPMMTSDEKVALRKVFSEGVSLALMGIAVGLLFGYDPDDPDRFNKLRQRQLDYGALGYLSNHLLYQLISVKSENELLVPIAGFNDFNEFLDKTTLASGPVIGNSLKILQDLWYVAWGDERAMYKQDVGPYPWQTEGNYKLWNHIGGIFGVKGKNYDAIWALKRFEQFQNLS